MGTISIKSSNLSIQAEYTNESGNIVVDFAYQKDTANSKLVSVNATVNTVSEGVKTYVGSYFGNADAQGNIRYSFSDIRDLTIMDDIVAIAQEIETYAKGEN